jgi:hypothetical protein
LQALGYQDCRINPSSSGACSAKAGPSNEGTTT